MRSDRNSQTLRLGQMSRESPQREQVISRQLYQLVAAQVGGTVTPEKEMISLWGMSWLVADKEINNGINDEINDPLAMSGSSTNINKETPAMEKPLDSLLPFFPRR